LTIAALAVVIGVAMLLYLQPGQSASASNSQATKKSLAGAWMTKIEFKSTPPPQIPSGKEASTQGFNKDGLVVEANTAGTGTGVGEWKPNGKKGGFEYTFREIITTPGTCCDSYIYVIVRQTGTVSADGKSYSSSGSGQVYSSTGAPLGPPSQTVSEGTRVTL
jgi:hypothetical protein